MATTDTLYCIRWAGPADKLQWGSDQVGKYVHRCMEPVSKDQFCYGDKPGCAALTDHEIRIYFEKDVLSGAAKQIILPAGHREDTLEKRRKRMAGDACNLVDMEDFMRNAECRSTEDLAVRVFAFCQRSSDEPLVDRLTGEMIHESAVERAKLTDGAPSGGGV